MHDSFSPAAIGNVRTLWSLLRNHWGMLLGWLAALACASALTLRLPIAFRTLVDESLIHGAAAINTAFLLVFSIVIAIALTSAAQFLFISLLGERVVADLRDRLYSHLIGMDAEFHDRNRSGELVSRLVADTEILRSVVGFTISSALRGSITLVGSFAMLFITSPRLAGYAMIGIPLTVLPVFLSGQLLGHISRTTQDRLAEANALAAETLSAVRTVQSHSREPFERSRFARQLKATITAANKRIRIQTLVTAVGTTVVFTAFTLVLWSGAHDVAAGKLSPGTLAQFLIYAVISATSIGALTEVWSDIRYATGGMGRISELLILQPAITAPERPKIFPSEIRGEVGIHQVTFHYPQRPEHAALIDFDLHVKPGETIALVGPSGAGKSTVFSLLARFYDPQSGVITIDGIDIRATDPADLRQVLGTVPQQPSIFSASARSNILYGRLDANEDELAAAVAAAQATAFITRLPEGLDTELGEHGTRLSGGQQQRIAIARALLKDAPILLLDEATSALDAQSERAVQQALDALMNGRTCIVIAHRLATVLKADRIVVMDDGRIVAEGTHDQLLAAGGLYADLARLQFIAGRDTQPSES